MFLRVLAGLLLNFATVFADHISFIRQFRLSVTICDLVVTPICFRASKVFESIGFFKMLRTQLLNFERDSILPRHTFLFGISHSEQANESGVALSCIQTRLFKAFLLLLTLRLNFCAYILAIW
jgi:hypothetical protein